MYRFVFLLATTYIFVFFVSCTPIKSSPKDEKHQMELTLHEVQTNVDDLRHDLNCFKTDLQIIEGKIQNQEKQMEVVKQQQISQTLARLDVLTEKFKNLDTKLIKVEKHQEETFADLNKLSMHSKEVISSLTQYKDKILELEKNLIAYSKRFEEVKKLKQTLEAIAATLKINVDGFVFYRVKAGDSLEKIAKLHKTTVENLKKINNLEQDLIVVGQELKIPK